MIRLSRREKRLALALAASAIVLSVYAFAVAPAVDRIDTLRRIIPQKQDEFRRLSAVSRQYVFLRDSFNAFRTKLASQREGFQLLPFLESLIRESQLEGRLASMEQDDVPLEADYSEMVVRIRLESLTLAELVDFLAKVETSDVLAKTSSLHIKTNPTNPDLLEADIEIRGARLTGGQVARM